ncbi:hypothetical protein DIPPA_07099 [Diplonema papillatum]|nr:hypothetical protein DIPPA_07099 [Diplonema papillatum]
MIRRCGALLAPLRATRALLNLHIHPPSEELLEAHHRHLSRKPEIVHFTDVDGETHTMNWEDFKTYQDAAKKDRRAEDATQFCVRLKNVPAEGSRLAYAMTIFRNAPLDEAEANARFMSNVRYAEIFIALCKMIRKEAIARNMNPSQIRIRTTDFVQEAEAAKHILFRAKGYYGEYMVRTYTLSAMCQHDTRAEETSLRMDRYFSWKYGKRASTSGLASEMDVPALGVDGL